MTSADPHRPLLPPAPGDMPVPSPQTQQPPPSPRRTPRVAVVSLTFGLIAFFTMLAFIGAAFAVIAVITGHVALSRIRHSPSRYSGDGVAMTGVFLGYFTLVGTSILMLLGLVFYQPAMNTLEQYRQHESMRHASHLYLASEAYARDHKGAYPKQWDELRGRYINSIELTDYLDSVHFFGDSEEPAFKLVPHQRPVLSAVFSQVVVIQEIAPPEIDLIAVVYADGNTELILNPNFSSNH